METVGVTASVGPQAYIFITYGGNPHFYAHVLLQSVSPTVADAQSGAFVHKETQENSTFSSFHSPYLHPLSSLCSHVTTSTGFSFRVTSFQRELPLRLGAQL